MNPSSSQGFGGRRSKREVVDVLEPKAVDRTLDRLLDVRKHRLERFERESLAARQEWRLERTRLGDCKRQWRAADQYARDYWQEARAQFFAMASTSGQFRAAKGGFARLKREAAEVLLTWRDKRSACKGAHQAYITARDRLNQARRQQEKLGMFRDEQLLANLRYDD